MEYKKNLAIFWSKLFAKQIGNLNLSKRLSSAWFSGWVVLMTSWGMYFAYLWPQMLYFDYKGLQAGWIGVWGDWAAHITYANVFALRPIGQWLTTHPIHINSPFTYPFLADALSGVLMRFGWSVTSAFVWPSLITSLFFLTVLYLFYGQIVKKPSRALVAVSLFLLNGGMGWWWFLKDYLATPSLETIAYPPQEYTHLYKQYIEWISIVTSEMIPQRAFLLGFPLTILIIWQLWSWSKQQFKGVAWWRVIVLGFLAGTLFFVHAHSFIALFLVCSVLTVYNVRGWKHWLVFAASTSFVALPIAFALHSGHASNFFKFLPGWFAHSSSHNINWFYFWWVNYGLFLPLAVWGTIKNKWYREPLVMAGWLIFVALNLIQFQPHIWDNTKMVTWAHFFLVIPVWSVLKDLYNWTIYFKTKPLQLGKVLAVWLFVIITASSWLDVWHFTRVDKNSYQMWSHEDLQMASTLNSISQPGDRVLTGQNHNSWVVAHTHLQTLLGFPGWLWTYGVTDPVLAQDIMDMFAGQEKSCQLLKQYEIRYVVIGSPERYDQKANQAWFEANFETVVKGGEYTTYQVPENLEPSKCLRVQAGTAN